MLIDLHCHTSQRSSCSMADEEDLIKRARLRGLGGLAFTDHGCLPPPERVQELNAMHHPFHVFTGIEISLHTSEGICDFLVIGLNDPVLMSTSWTYGKLVNWVRKNNGWIAMAHPYRYGRNIPIEVIKHPPDAFEIWSTNIDQKLRKRIAAMAKECGCGVIGASDAHLPEDVGCYAIELFEPVASDIELVSALREGRFRRVSLLSNG